MFAIAFSAGRLGVPALDADHDEAFFGNRREQPGAVRERFQADALEVDSRFRQEQLDRVRVGLECRFLNDVAVAVHRTNIRCMQ
ncbi:hypothetical protein ACVWZZ_005628 [Bradyrhizobium sp. LM6.10]